MNSTSTQTCVATGGITRDCLRVIWLTWMDVAHVTNPRSLRKCLPTANHSSRHPQLTRKNQKTIFPTMIPTTQWMSTRVAVKNIRRLIISVDQGRRTTRFGRDRLPQPGKLLLIVIPDPVRLLISARRYRTPRNTYIDHQTRPTFALAQIPGFPQPYGLLSPVTPRVARSRGRMDQSQVVHNPHTFNFISCQSFVGPLLILHTNTCILISPRASI